MGKKKKVEPKLSKKDRKKLAAREAEIRAEIERREAEKKTKKKGKKAKAEKPSKKTKKVDAVEVVDASALGTMTVEAEAPIASEPPAAEEEATERHPHLKHLDRVGELNAIVNDSSAKKKARAEAGAELAKLREEGAARLAEKDAELREKIRAKREAREAGKKGNPARMPDALDGETEPEYQMRKLREKKAAQATEIVETENGREFAVGESVAASEPETFAKPSDAPAELEEGRNGYKIIMLGEDGKPDPRKVRQMTRVTTFVSNIDDETMIRDWEKRLLAVGLSASADEYVPKINDLVHRRDVTIAKAHKADRKGKLDVGEAGRIETAAHKAFKDAIKPLVEEAMEAAGRHAKADAGTDLHTLAELSDAEGIKAVRALHEASEITDTELASIEAYAARMDRLGAKVIHSEAVIVNDAMKYAGRLDRVIMAKLPALVINGVERPADQRARRYIADIKSGRIDLGAGKIARQLSAYALGDLYDLETGERSRHSAARDVALVFHLPQGEGVCTVHAVDLKEGTRLLKLSAEVRTARNTGKKTIDASVDITDPAPGGTPLDESEA